MAKKQHPPAKCQALTRRNCSQSQLVHFHVIIACASSRESLETPPTHKTSPASFIQLHSCAGGSHNFAHYAQPHACTCPTQSTDVVTRSVNRITSDTENSPVLHMCTQTSASLKCWMYKNVSRMTIKQYQETLLIKPIKAPTFSEHPTKVCS
jgi:hypothetical protein